MQGQDEVIYIQVNAAGFIGDKREKGSAWIAAVLEYPLHNEGCESISQFPSCQTCSGVKLFTFNLQEG